MVTTIATPTTKLPVPAWRQAVDDTDGHRQLTTLEGWREFTAAATVPPDLLGEQQWTTLADADRIDYDELRLDYHTRLAAVATSTLRQVVNTGRRLTLLNRHTISARRGLILSGAAGTGKTTAITQFGKTHQAADRQRHPGTADRIPVIYITVPPAATPRMVAAEFARFLGLPFTTRSNITDIIEAVCGVAVDARVSVVACDEIHNLSLATRTGADVSDTLKYFSERIPATFVYAGIDVEREGLFTGTRGRQIAGRFCLITTSPFPRGPEWEGLVATLEQALRLHRHTPGTLPAAERYLHQRTAGMIGSLSHLIRGAALEAVLCGTEKITTKLLDTIALDHAAQHRHDSRTTVTAGRKPAGRKPW
jgi:Bacterial TniB protein